MVWGGDKSSVFLVEHCLISVCSEQDVQHPVGRPSHLFTDGFQISTWIAFYDQFIMNVSDDEAVAEGLHGIAEYVAADVLDNILHEFRTVGFDAFPFLCGAHAFVGNGFPAELVFSDTGLHICQIAA